MAHAYRTPRRWALPGHGLGAADAPKGATVGAPSTVAVPITL